jgi:ABC-type lipoprotein export system ATPase subunit
VGLNVVLPVRFRSGSGKTTFLTTLAGRATYGDQSGRVWLNNK